MRNTSVILAIAGGMLIMVAVAAGPDGGKLPERPLGTAQESIGRTSAALGQELDTIGPGFLAEKQAIDRKAARKAPTLVGASQVQDAPLPALDTSGEQVSARSAGVPFVQAEIVDGPLPRFQIADDGLLLRPNHPPLDQIPPAPMPMTVDQRALADPGAPLFHDAITGETIVLPIDRAISSDKLGEIPGYDGADGGLGGEDRTRTFWDMYRVTNTEDFPWRMNVKLVMHFVDEIGDDRWFGCSGSMIDAETVLCAGHCVYLRAVDGPDIYDWAEEIWVYPGRDGDEYPYGYGHGTHFGAWTGWTDGGSFDYDAGLIEITRAVGMLTGWFGKAWDGSCSWVLGQTYNNASYPGEDCPDPGLHTGVHMYYWYGHFDSCPGNQLQINTGGGHCFDTVWGGMSGSGAYYIDNGSRYVHAVCSNSNRTTSGRYCKLWGNWASFMNGTFIPGARGGSFDLQALDANAEPATVPAGSALSLANFLAANPTNASASGSWTVRTYLSTDDNISGGDTLLGTGVFNWNFGMMSSVRVGLGAPTIPINTPPGNYWFGVELDPATDGNSSNNSTDGWDAVPLTVTPAPPPNDDCGSAITIPSTPIAPYNPPLLDTRGATSAASDPLQTCTYNGPNRNSNTVWYVYTPPCDGLVNVSTCGSSYDTVVSVFTGSCGSLSEIGCNDDSCGYQSEITGLAVTGLQPIYIEVSDYNLPGGGDLDFHLDFVPTGIPSNDDCANAQFVGIPSSTIGTTNCAMVDDYAPDCPDQAPPYYPVNVTSPGVWYGVIGTGRMLTATTCNDFSTYDTKISVYCNSCDTLTCVAGNDDDCTGHPPVLSTVSWCSQYGAEYLILVHGFYRVTGGFRLDVYQGDAPCGDAAECGGEAIGACCAGWACTEGGSCSTGFRNCGGDHDCYCFDTYEGDLVCAETQLCSGLTPCPNGTSECPTGEVCIVNTCCANPSVCVTPGCPAAPEGLYANPAEATASGLEGQTTAGGRIAEATRISGICKETTQSRCETHGNTYRGDGVSCAQTYCPGPTGACCVDGDCVGTMEEPYCLRQGGEWFAGEDCATFLCPEPPPMGACCAPWVCTKGFVCEGDHWPVCNGTFGQCFCFNTAGGELACLDAVNQDCGEPCDATMSCPVGYVCVVDTCCEVDGERVPVCLKEGCPLSDPTGQVSAIGEPGPLGELSIEQPAAERGVDQQGCLDLEKTQCDFVVGLYQGDDTICEDTVCPGPPHACCLPDGRCAEAGHTKCVEHGGDPQGPGTTCDMIVCQPLKWSQPPVFGMTPQYSECFLGWDEQSIYRSQQIVADDWLCSNDQPVTDVHWWGSYLQWSQTEPPQEGAPKGFHIGIWTDEPAGGQLPFSHPGKMIHEWIVERRELNERAVGCDYYPEHSVDTCFRYDFVIPTRDQWFSQESACEIYWVSIAAIYADVPSRNPWGWKTREHFFHDAAVRIFSPTDPSVPAEFHDGKPIEDPLGVRWDMAFVLTTTLPEQGCCLNDGNCIDVPPHTCLQLRGVPQGEGTRCTQSQACCLDDSTCIDVDPLCCDDFGGIPQGVGTQCTAEEACCLPDGTCRMLDPLCCGALDGTPQGAGTTCTEPEGCCLGNGTCLDLDPLCCDEFGGTPQGSGTACVDTTIACCNPVGASCIKTDPLCCDEMGGVPSPIGSAVCLGDGDGNGIDDACEVPPQACCLRDGSCVDTHHDDCVDRGGDPQGPRTRCDGVTCQPLKWSQPPMFNPDSQYPDCFWGWDEMSIYRSQQIVADDWLCDNTQPITDIHWWGSYYRWNSPEPPDEGPTLFHIGIWTDVPAGAHGLLFSHPGKMIHEWVVDRRALKERVVGCDFYPERPQDTCFRYNFIIPREKWFYQEAACEIYWISIAAIYPDDYFGRSFWGWKTRKHRFGDAAVRVFSPTDPRLPDEFREGQPIEDPLRVPWDMAFVLTTTHATEACCLQDQSCLDVVREVCMEMGGKPQGRDTECTQPQACCRDDGTCIDIDPLCCDEFEGTPQGPGTRCTVEQACCLPDATCQVLDPLCCRNMGGRPQGAGTDCTEPEACCLRDGKCLDVDPLCCDEFGGEPQGSGTACQGDLDGNGIDEACELDDVCEDCGPGDHWVDQCAAGSDDMPSGALVGIDLDLDCQADVSMVLSGAVSILRSNPLDDSVNFPGTRPLDGHLDVIDTEIVSMSLVNLATGVILTAGAGTGQGGVLGPSLGAIAEQAGDPAIADSFFDVLFEVGLDDDLYVYNHMPLRVDSKIICVPPDATYIHPVGCIPLYDTPLPNQGTVVANLVTADHSTYPGCGDPTTGDCFDPNNGTPYCDDAECCEAVCRQLPHCCELIWDTDCTGVAVEVCHPIEACCLPDGQCAELTLTDCRAQFGIPQGPGTTCANVDCPLPPVIEVDQFDYSIGEFEVSGPFGTEIIHASGPATVHVFFEGSTEGTADDDDTDGFDEVTIQMVDLNLTGLSPLLGPVHVTLNPNLPSFGEIEETVNNTPGVLDLPPFTPTGTANSYFNLFFKIEVGGQTYFTIDPKQMRSVITHKPPGPTDLYENLDRIELYDENGDPTGVFLDASRHRPNPPEACCLPDGRCREIPVGECFDSDGLPLGPATLCEGDSNQNGIDDACELENACADCGPGDHWLDDCAGGNDNMPTSAIVGIDLNGDCQPDTSLVLSGPVSIWRSNPRDASWQFMGVGVLDSHTDVIDTEIVSMSLTNAAAGVTFTVGAGLGQGGALPASFGAILEQEGDPTMADSFFDVFFEADLGGGMYAYNHVPLRVSTKIDCLPPKAMYIHPVVCIPLFDAAGNQVGNLVTADHSTYPECGDPTTGNCFEPNGTPYCDDAECCRAVCEQLPHCCDVAWDQHCAAVAQEICRPCPQARIIESMPPNGVVDARQPNTPRDPLPRQGIGTEDEPIVVALDPPITDAAHCFNLCETAADQILGVNLIVSVSGSGTGQYKIVLHHAITAGAVTTIQYKGGGSYVEFTSHPANVNADSAAAPSDILRIIDYINGVATSQWGIYSEDVDRSNLLGPPDILRVIDLLNGAGVFASWLNSPLPLNTSCP